MSGQATPLGVLSVSDAIPGLVELDALARAAQAVAITEIQGKLAGLASVQLGLTFPPPPGVVAAAAAKMAAQLALNPSIAAPSLQVSANAKIIAELQLQLAALTMPDLLGAFGIGAFKYQGTMSSCGPALGTVTQNGLPGGTGNDAAYGILLIATEPAAIAALQSLLVSG